MALPSVCMCFCLPSVFNSRPKETHGIHWKKSHTDAVSLHYLWCFGGRTPSNNPWDKTAKMIQHVQCVESRLQPPKVGPCNNSLLQDWCCFCPDGHWMFKFLQHECWNAWAHALETVGKWRVSKCSNWKSTLHPVPRLSLYAGKVLGNYDWKFQNISKHIFWNPLSWKDMNCLWQWDITNQYKSMNCKKYNWNGTLHSEFTCIRGPACCCWLCRQCRIHSWWSSLTEACCGGTLEWSRFSEPFPRYKNKIKALFHIELLAWADFT